MDKEDSGAFFTVTTLLISLSLYSRIGYDKGLIPLISKSETIDIKSINLARSIIFSFYGNLITIIMLLVYNVDNFSVYFIMPLITLNNVFVAYFKSVSKPNTSFLFDSSFIYCILLIPLLVSYALGVNLELNQVLLIYIISVIIQSSMLFFLVKKEPLNCNFDLYNLNISFYAYLKDIYKMRHFLFITILANLSRLLPVIVLSTFFNNKEVSTFKVLEQIAMSGTIIITVVNSIYSIKYVESKHDLNKIQNTVFQSSAITLMFSLIYFSAVYFLGSYVLDFAKVDVNANSLYFSIMLIATFVNIISAPIYNALTMVGEEKGASLVLFVSILSFTMTLLFGAYFQNINLIYGSVLVFYTSQFLISLLLFWKYCNAIK